jgi:hypothetical protein
MITLQYLNGSFLASIYIHFIPSYVREKCELVVGEGDYFLNSKTIRTVFLLVQKAASIDVTVLLPGKVVWK